MLEKGVVVYLNDILIVSFTKEENIKKVKQIKRLLSETNL